MAEPKTATDILLNNVRLSYAYLYSPYEGDEGNKSYCAHLILPETHTQMPALQALIRKVATDMWADKTAEVLAQLKAQDRLCIHRGDVNKPGADAYKGQLYISSSSKIKPRILATVNGMNQEIDEDHDKAPYSGCRAHVKINIWAQNNKWGKRINAQLMGVQFFLHDDRLSSAGRIASVDEFGTVAADADEAAPAALASEGLV